MTRALITPLVLLLVLAQVCLGYARGQIICVPLGDCATHACDAVAGHDHHGDDEAACGHDHGHSHAHDHGPVSDTGHEHSDCGCHIHLPLSGEDQPQPSQARVLVVDLGLSAIGLAAASPLLVSEPLQLRSVPIGPAPAAGLRAQSCALRSTRLLI